MWLMREIRQTTSTVHPGFESTHLSQQPLGGPHDSREMEFQPVLAGKQTANILSVIRKASLPKRGQEVVFQVITATFNSPQDV